MTAKPRHKLREESASSVQVGCIGLTGEGFRSVCVWEWGGGGVTLAQNWQLEEKGADQEVGHISATRSLLSKKP